MFKRVLAVAFEKQSEGNAQFALGSGRGRVARRRWRVRAVHAFVHRTAPARRTTSGRMVAVKDRQNAVKNPYAHLKIHDISLEKVHASPMMWDPVRFLESCPSSDGACAVVFTDEDGGKAAKSDGRPPAWVLGTAVRSRARQLPGTRPGAPAGRGRLRLRTSTGRRASPTRVEQIDCAELYVPFSWYEPMWLEGPRHRRARRGLEDGRAAATPRSTARSR